VQAHTSSHFANHTKKRQNLSGAGQYSLNPDPHLIFLVTKKGKICSEVCYQNLQFTVIYPWAYMKDFQATVEASNPQAI
jgi:hypothetical protein